MKKIRLQWMIAGFILLCIFNFLFFWIDFNKASPSVWISYSFIHLAYIQLIMIPFIVPQSRSTHLFVESVFAVSAVYLIIEIILGSVFIILSLQSWKIVFLVQLIIFLVNGSILYISILLNRRTADTEAHKKKSQKMLKLSINYLEQAAQFVGKEDKALISDAYDDLKSSPLLVDESVQGIEGNILACCKNILDYAQEHNVGEMRKQISLVTQMVRLRKIN